MLPTILDIVAAYLIVRGLRHKWWAWLPAALLLGATISLVYFLAAGLLGFLTPGNAVYQGIYNMPLNAGVCALYSWWLRRSKA
jgi:hypothetical protein